MKIFKSSLLILFALVLLVSCSKDDGGNNVAPPVEELTVIVEGVEKTFNSIVLSTNTFTNANDEVVTYKTVTATIDGNTAEIIHFQLGNESTGANVLWSFEYTLNGDVYNDTNSSAITSVVSVNNETTLTATFSGYVEKWNNNTMMHDSVSFLNGSVTANQ